MISQSALTSYLDTLLECNQFSDYAPNGLQVQGAAQIHTICSAVTASAEVIDKAARLNAHALLVHHGYFWKGEPQVLTGMKYARIARLIHANINLLAYHLPLDCHKTLGNNAQIGHYLPLEKIESFHIDKNPNLLWIGQTNKAWSLEQFAGMLTKIFKQTPLLIKGHNRPLARIAWCSGGAQDFIVQAHSLQADMYLSGEASERTYYLAKELGIHYAACGHHATERFGVQALGNHLAQKFSLTHHFIDTDNPF